MASFKSYDVTRIKWTARALFDKKIRNKNMLSSSQTKSALRPFYLLVHPDFFAQHPKIQKVNEASLKQLNNYLEALHCSNQIRSLQPTRVAFYFKRKRDQNSPSNDDFKLIHFTLRSLDLKTNIEHILASCNLPAEHIEELLQPNGTQDSSLHTRYRKTYPDSVNWSRSDYERDFQEQEIDSTLKLRQWLKKNAADCHKQQNSSRAVRENNETLKSDICMQLGLREIKWCSPWQYASEQGILRNFARFCSQHTDQVRCLQRRRLVFTDKTMTGADESVCLNVEDVPQQWLQFLSKYSEKSTQYFTRAQRLDDFVCGSCGNIKIIRPKVRTSRFREHSLVSIDDYISILSKISTRLKSVEHDENLKILPWSMRNLEMTFVKLQEPGAPPVSIFPNGRFRVNKNCNSHYLLNYVIKNKSLAEEKKYINARDKAQANQLSLLCKEKMGILSISKDFDVEHHKMIKCCEKLLQNSHLFDISLEGLEIRITAKYFSVFDHGSMCIPWDWKL